MLKSKYGPVAAKKSNRNNIEILESYMRISQAVLEVNGGPLYAPVLHLSDEQLVALFNPRIMKALVEQPFIRVGI